MERPTERVQTRLIFSDKESGVEVEFTSRQTPTTPILLSIVTKCIATKRLGPHIVTKKIITKRFGRRIVIKIIVIKYIEDDIGIYCIAFLERADIITDYLI